MQEISVTDFDDGEQEIVDIEEMYIGYFSGSEIEVKNKCKELQIGRAPKIPLYIEPAFNEYPRFVYEKLDEIK